MTCNWHSRLLFWRSKTVNLQKNIITRSRVYCPWVYSGQPQRFLTSSEGRTRNNNFLNTYKNKKKTLKNNRYTADDSIRVEITSAQNSNDRWHATSARTNRVVNTGPTATHRNFQSYFPPPPQSTQHFLVKTSERTDTDQSLLLVAKPIPSPCRTSCSPCWTRRRWAGSCRSFPWSGPAPRPRRSVDRPWFVSNVFRSCVYLKRKGKQNLKNVIAGPSRSSSTTTQRDRLRSLSRHT